MSKVSKRAELGDGRAAAVRRLFRCPATGAELVDAEGGFVCCDPHRRLRYSILEGIPVLLVEEAIELPPADWAAAMAAAGHDPLTGRPIIADADKADRSGD